MSPDDRPLEEADTMAAEPDEDDLGSAKTAAATEPERSPSQRVLHADVKRALFTDEAPVRPETGKVFAGRYRIEQRLGEGGMGEVFRAHDLVLEEDVAIKLLPRTLAARPGYYERFLQEVRVARQVSHPSVCRVHDIGEADGQPFISMEYIDGEDLASLLRRIGRLGEEKAVELAHQLCNGLAALHERGIIHRDLKPSNVMLDGTGHIRIADFGLASVAEELREHEIRDGTPAYQAPEQREGREATVRSDVYALGLVLREMFLGRAPGPASSTGSTISNESVLDPAITEVIDRCLRPNPAERPESTLAVSASLPGGDPLAAALAAGRLPSPEAVANATTVGGLSSVVAYGLAAAATVALLVLVFLNAEQSALGRSDDLLDPAVLEHRALQILESVDAQPQPMDTVSLDHDLEAVYRLRDAEETSDEPEGVSLFQFTYRQFGGSTALAAIGMELTPVYAPGDLTLILDGRGRLVSFERVLPEDSPESAPDDPWALMLKHAEIDSDSVEDVEPTKTPPMYADDVRAFHSTIGAQSVVVHAANVQGFPVWFEVERGWESPNLHREVTGWKGAAFLVLALTLVAVAVVTLRDAIATLRRREGDFRGAWVVAVFSFTLQLVGFLLAAQGPEILTAFLETFSFAGRAVLVWLLYLMLEPYARANWPRTLVSWNRLLQGRLRDPMIGRDLVLGAIAGAGFVIALSVAQNGVTAFGTASLQGTRFALASIPESASAGLIITFVLYVALLGLERLFRLQWLAIGLYCTVVPSMALLAEFPLEQVFATVLAAAGSAVLMLRFGLLAIFFSTFAYLLCTQLPIALGLGAWWTGTGLFGFILVAGMAACGAWLATAPSRAARAS